MNKLLEKYIKYLLEYETNATEEMPFGNHLFGDPRKKGEADTKSEDFIYAILSRWIKDESFTTYLEKHIDELAYLLKTGKYKDVLSPPSGVVWRGTSIPFEEATLYSIPNKVVSDIRNGHRKSFLIRKNFDWTPRGNRFSSWSYKLNIAIDFMLESARHHKSFSNKEIGIILRAEVPTNGKFIFNWKEVPVMVQQKEQEVISIGKVKSSVYVIPPIEFDWANAGRVMDIMDDIEKLGE